MRNLSSAMSSSDTHSFSSRSNRMPDLRPTSYGVRRGILPEIRKKSSSTVCASACFSTRPPAASSSSNVGSAWNEKMVSPTRPPR